MDKDPGARTSGANLIDGDEFVRREPALARVLADMALCALRRRARRDEPEGGSTERPPTTTRAELAASQIADNG